MTGRVERSVVIGWRQFEFRWGSATPPSSVRSAQRGQPEVVTDALSDEGIVYVDRFSVELDCHRRGEPPDEGRRFLRGTEHAPPVAAPIFLDELERLLRLLANPLLHGRVHDAGVERVGAEGQVLFVERRRHR